MAGDGGGWWGSFRKWAKIKQRREKELGFKLSLYIFCSLLNINLVERRGKDNQGVIVE